MVPVVITVVWAVAATVVVSAVWRSEDSNSEPVWVRAGGAALLGIFGGGVAAGMALLAIALLSGVT